jgi:hypothetical protein
MGKLTERFTVNEFHDDERMVILLANITVRANIINGADAGMIESGGGVSFSAETPQSFRVLLPIMGQKFQGHDSIEASVHRFVDDTHAARAKFFQNAIGRDNPVNHWRARFLTATIKNQRV